MKEYLNRRQMTLKQLLAADNITTLQAAKQLIGSLGLLDSASHKELEAALIEPVKIPQAQVEKPHFHEADTEKPVSIKKQKQDKALKLDSVL